MSDQLAAPQETIHGLPCSIGALRAELPDDERAGLDRLLSNRKLSAWGVVEELAEEGHTVPWAQVGKHRRGQCRCAKARP